MTKLFEAQSREVDHEKRLKMVWDIDRKLQEDIARPDHHPRPRRRLLAALRQGRGPAHQQHLQRLALRGRVAGSLTRVGLIKARHLRVARDL